MTKKLYKIFSEKANIEAPLQACRFYKLAKGS